MTLIGGLDFIAFCFLKLPQIHWGKGRIEICQTKWLYPEIGMSLGHFGLLPYKFLCFEYFFILVSERVVLSLLKVYCVTEVDTFLPDFNSGVRSWGPHAVCMTWAA